MDNSCHSVAGTGITTMIHGPLLHNPSTTHSTSKTAWADLSGPFADKTQALVAEGPVFLVTVPVSNQDHFTCPYSIIADQGWTKRHPRGTPNATLFLPSCCITRQCQGQLSCQETPPFVLQSPDHRSLKSSIDAMVQCGLYHCLQSLVGIPWLYSPGTASTTACIDCRTLSC